MKILQTLQMLALITVSFVTSANTDDTFDSISAGIKITKPASWHFLSAQQNIENLKSVDWRNAKTKDLVLKYAKAPLVAMMKYPEPYEDINPSLKINIQSLGDFSADNPNNILNLILPHLKKAFIDLEVIQEPIEITLSGLKASYMRFNYNLVVPGGESFPTTSEMWLVPRGDYYFMIGSGTRQDEKTGSRKEIKEILNTLIIDK
ncbi:hypothetical protein [Colwellia echini]|uniref:Uncharacterized protein n=1 Tax=Colwellia echini TaxID=1982103 RepID=A0ABY3MUC9_9GAMM|nr:hypothetical protein [Colwellia echini]TYK64672.1 hypothetical protein CWS31_014570 [Colwellia echini]